MHPVIVVSQHWGKSADLLDSEQRKGRRYLSPRSASRLLFIGAGSALNKPMVVLRKVPSLPDAEPVEARRKLENASIDFGQSFSV